MGTFSSFALFFFFFSYSIPIYMGPKQLDFRAKLQKTENKLCYYICFLTYGNHLAEKLYLIAHL